MPFDDENIPNLLEKIKLGHYEMKEMIQGEARDLISKILVTEPSSRLPVSLHSDDLSEPLFDTLIASYLQLREVRQHGYLSRQVALAEVLGHHDEPAPKLAAVQDTNLCKRSLSELAKLFECCETDIQMNLLHPDR